jgi:hypothetical protein
MFCLFMANNSSQRGAAYCISLFLSCHPISVKAWERHLPYLSLVFYFCV